MARPENLRNTVTRAFARTVVDSRTSATAEDGPESVVTLPDVGDIVGEHYRLIRVLGQGMFGKVYVAQRVDVPEHQVALKLLPRSLYQGRNVERELVMLATVAHPHVVQLKDHGWNDDYVWLTMPVYDGETLFDRLKRRPLGMREGHDIFVPIAHALEALHAAGLRHQDIKPENIYLALFGGRVHPILLDLGVAAEREAPFVAGTALFASPEQLLAFTGVPGAIPLSEKMDTYCLASTLLAALVKPEEFPGNGAGSRDEIAAAHELRATAPLAPDALPELVGAPREALESSFKRWLSLDPAERPSMSTLATELEVLLEPEREAARVEIRTKARQRRSLQRFRIVIGAMLVLGVAGLVVAYSQRETLRLANELNVARGKSAESFDKLDTCIASHQVSRADLVACRAGLDKERAEFRHELGEIQKSGSTSEVERARAIEKLQTTYAARMRSCEDGAAAAEKAAVAEREREANQCQTARAAVASQRDEALAIADSRAAEAKAFTAQRDECVAARAACVSERDVCLAAPGASRPPLAPAVAPSGSPAEPAASTSPQPRASASAPVPSPVPSPAEPATKPVALP